MACWPDPAPGLQGHVSGVSLAGTNGTWLAAGDDVMCADVRDLTQAQPLPLASAAVGRTLLATSPVDGAGQFAGAVVSRRGATVALFRAHQPCTAVEATTVSVSWPFPGEVYAAAIAADGSLFVGADRGVWHLPLGEGASRFLATESRVTHLALSSTGHVAAATRNKLWRCPGCIDGPAPPPASAWRWEWAWGLLDGTQSGDREDGGTVSGLAFDSSGTLWAGTREAVASIEPVHGAFTRIRGVDGLPAVPVLSVATGGDNSVYFGTPRGLARRSPDGTWQWFNSGRWLATAKDAMPSPVLAVAAAGTRVVVATAGGLAVLQLEEMSLQEKGDALVEVQQHTRWHGLVSASPLAAVGDLASAAPVPNENHGQWTSMALAAASLKYAVTGNQADRDAAAELFDGLHLLSRVTGIPGYPSRTVSAPGDAQPWNRWGWNPSPVPEYEGWNFLGNTSTDETTGHFFAYPIYADLAASNDADRKAAAVALHCNLTRNIVTHGYQLPDVDGAPTTWGKWNPALLNGDRDWAEDRGGNSLEILSYLVSAHRLCPSDRGDFAAAFWDLVDTHGYAENIVNQQMSTPASVNYQDHLLAYLSFYTVQFACRKEGLPKDTAPLCDRLAGPLGAAVEVAFRATSPQKNAVHAYVYAAVAGGDESALQQWRADALEFLEEFPIERIDWALGDDGHKRLDITIDQDLLPAMVQAREALSRFGANVDVGNDPMTLHSCGTKGKSTLDVSPYLLALALGTYHGFLDAGA